MILKGAKIKVVVITDIKPTFYKLKYVWKYPPIDGYWQSSPIKSNLDLFYKSVRLM